MTYRNAWVAAASLDEFMRTTVPVLAAERTRNTLSLTVLDRLRIEGPHAFGEREPQLLTWYGEDGSILGALIRTPPYPFVLSDVPAESLGLLADLLLDPESGLDSREINLPDSCEAPLCAALTARTGKKPRILERFRLHRLGELLDPDPAPAGQAKIATSDDVAVIADYLEAFWNEVEHAGPEDARATAVRMAERRVPEGVFRLWLDESGVPVSCAAYSPIVAGMSRIGPVYTPPEARGHGYAAGATVAATRAAIEHGADEVLLFTDLANPVSNRLYQRLGYRPVSDRARIEFEG